LNIRTAIFHCIYRQLQTNSGNETNFTDIPLYFILQRQLYEDIIKRDSRVDMFSTCSQFFLCLFFILMADDYSSLSLSPAVNSKTQLA